MLHTREEIFEALLVIKEECENNSECKNCPFSYKDEEEYCKCRIVNEEKTPNMWKLNNDNNWKAFR